MSYASLETAVCKAQAEHRLNLGDDWKETLLAIAANDGCCTCQPGKVKCPCQEGVAMAAVEGQCHCGLFVRPPEA